MDNVPYGAELEQGAHQLVDHLPKLPKDAPHVNMPAWLNPLRQPAHKPPPEQADSKSGDMSWFSDFKWRNPFSSSVTADDRSVLPPVMDMPPVYTYFDPPKNEKSKNAEHELLLIWRRAWWAQGFKPVVLSRSEAMNNPLYRRVQDLKLSEEIEAEMLRWLAWGNMGTGILCNWLALPMAHYDDPLLSFLRRGEYPTLTRYQGLDNGLFVGTKDHVEKALKIALESSDLQQASSIAEVTPPEAFKVDPDHEGIAFYSSATIKENYKRIQDKLDDDDTKAEGRTMLGRLINSHLQNTWQNHFSKGIAVLKPLAQNTTQMVEPAIDIARNLTQCASTPMPASCPPNQSKCRPCVSSQSMLISTPPVFRNTSTLFTIATVPHPYTLQSLIHAKGDLDLKFIRRKTNRDAWILAATKELLGTGWSSFARLAPLKDAVASEYGCARSLWLTAEEPIYLRTEKDLVELDWIFGFEIPRVGQGLKSGKSETPVPGPERRPPPPKQEFDGPVPSDKQLTKQKLLGDKARVAVKRGEKGGKKEFVALRDAIEAWNLADTEAWKFVRAFNARRQLERRKWEHEEESFLGKGTFDRWRDFVTHE